MTTIRKQIKNLKIIDQNGFDSFEKERKKGVMVAKEKTADNNG